MSTDKVVRLSARELQTIIEREAQNAQRMEGLRAMWAAAQEARAAYMLSILENQRPPRASTIELGPDARLLVGRKIIFHWKDLKIELTKLDEAKISRAMLRLQDYHHQWPDGTLRGLKRLLKSRAGYVSPNRATVWAGGECHATEFDEAGNLRGEAGIHAAWPDQVEELSGYQGKLVEIAGWGRCTLGDVGWRAEHAKVVAEIL